jgi:tetratricopeptide (TPR) repeat protein
MNPDQGVAATQTTELFEAGRWTELEHLYKSTLAEDDADARTAFRLANLLSYQGRWQEAQRYYGIAWTHRWPGAVTLSNKGVALACLGEARPAFHALKEALRFDSSCAPASYNMAILYKKLGNEGTLPQVLLDLGLGNAGQRASELTSAYFEGALSGVWPDSGPLDRPLFLWTEDLKPGFGFERISQIVNVEEALVYYDEGIERLEDGQWEEAISRLEGAARLDPELADRILAPRTLAEVKIAQARMAEVRRRWDDEDYEGASRIWDELLAKSATLPDRAFAEEILATGIESFAQQIRSHNPKDGLESLQKLITQARQRFERNGRNGEPTDGKPAAEGDGGGVPAAQSPVEVELEERGTLASAYIGQVCRDAWSREIDYLIAAGDFDSAIQLLTFSEVQWFAQDEIQDWRQRVYTAQALNLRARALDMKGEGNWRAALPVWREGRESAMLAVDPHLVDSFDSQEETFLSGLSPEERTEARDLLHGTDDLKALQDCQIDLAATPGDPRLLVRRHALVGQLLAQARDALEASQEEAARKILKAVLAVVPDHTEALTLLRGVQEGLSERQLARAERVFLEGDYTGAEKFCSAVSPLFPTHIGRALELRREIETVKSRQDEKSAYNEAFHKFLISQRRSDPKKRAEEAFKEAQHLYELDPRAAHTQEAVEWATQVNLDLLKARLAKERTKKTAEGIPGDIERLLSLRPDFKAAREFREEVRRVIEGQDTREKSLEKLGTARNALREKRFEDALAAIQAVLQMEDLDLREEALARRDEALDQLRHKVAENLVVAAHTPVEKALKILSEIEGYLAVCKPWDSAFVAAKEAEVDRLSHEVGEQKAANDEYATLRNEVVGKQAIHPLRALQELDRRVRTSSATGSSLLLYYRPQVLSLRNNLKRLMASPWSRTRLQLYERSNRTADLYREDPA